MNERFRRYILEVDDNIELYAENVDTFTEEEFANIRHNSFGASDSSRILNVNPFPNGSNEDLLYEKVHRLTNDEIGKKPSVRMGKELEPLIMEKLEKATGEIILKPTDMYYNKLTGQSVNFDGISLDENLQVYIPREIKTVSYWGSKFYQYGKAVNLDSEEIQKKSIATFIRDVPKDFTFKEMPQTELQKVIQFNAEHAGIPVYYYTQLQQQIAFLGAPYGTLTVLDTKEWTLFEFTIARADYVIDELAKEAMILRMKLDKARREEK